MSPRLAAILGSIFIMLIGVARGFGGVVLLATAQAATAETIAPSHLLALLGGGLVFVAVLCLWSGVAVLLRKPGGVRVGVVAMTLFVVGGAVNGTVLYGAPRPIGLLGNLLAAVVTVALLLRGRASLAPRRSQPRP